MKFAAVESLRVIIKLSDGSSSTPSSGSVFVDDELDRAASKIGQKQPSNSDKQVFTIIFSLKENSNMRWKVECKFSKFVDLNKHIASTIPHQMSTVFPSAVRRHSFTGGAVKLTDRQQEERRVTLNLWLREVLANFDFLPLEAKKKVVSFINMPKYLHILLVSSDQMDVFELKEQQKVPHLEGPAAFLNPASPRSLPSLDRLNAESFTPQSQGPGQGQALKQHSIESFTIPILPKDSEKFDFLFGSSTKCSRFEWVIRKLIGYMYAARSRWRGEQPLRATRLSAPSKCVCVCRSDHVIDYSGQNYLHLQLAKEFHRSGFGAYLSIMVVIFLQTETSYRVIWLQVWVVSAFYLVYLLFKDELEKIRLGGRNLNAPRGSERYLNAGSDFNSDFNSAFTAHRTTETILREYLQRPDLTYEENYSYPPALTTVSKRDPDLSQCASSSSVGGTPEGDDVFPAGPVEENDDLRRQKEAFYSFAFDDISDGERAFSVDRRLSHTFQVRGPNYLSDGKKVHPGNALCKLMLLEIYEVDASREPEGSKDRHDHVVTRGLARRRLEAIAALPCQPFQFIVNFQIPGDPPVSIVAYFALPPGVSNLPELQGSEGELSELEKFRRLFLSFVRLPVDERERRLVWGLPPDRPDSESDTTDSHPTSTSASSGKPPKSNRSTSGQNGGGGWMKMPSDISWPDPQDPDPGTLPSSDFRNVRFKLVQCVTEGPWVVRASVPAKPALLGKKVVQRYFRGERYFELDIHVGSSVIASQIVGVCRGYAKHGSADIGIVIQGEDPSELAEKMLACVCFNKIDIDKFKKPLD